MRSESIKNKHQNSAENRQTLMMVNNKVSQPIIEDERYRRLNKSLNVFNGKDQSRDKQQKNQDTSNLVHTLRKPNNKKKVIDFTKNQPVKEVVTLFDRKRQQRTIQLIDEFQNYGPTNGRKSRNNSRDQKKLIKNLPERKDIFYDRPIDEEILKKIELMKQKGAKRPNINPSQRKRAENLLKRQKNDPEIELNKSLKKINTDLDKSLSNISKMDSPKPVKITKNTHMLKEFKELLSKSSDHFVDLLAKKSNKIKLNPLFYDDKIENKLNRDKALGEKTKHKDEKKMRERVSVSPESGTFGQKSLTDISHTDSNIPKQPNYLYDLTDALKKQKNIDVTKKPTKFKVVPNKKSKVEEETQQLTIQQKLKVRIEHIEQQKAKNKLKELSSLLESQEMSQSQKEALINNPSFKSTLQKSIEVRRLEKDGLLDGDTAQLDLQKLIKSSDQQEISALMTKVDNKTSYQAIFKLQRKKNKHELLVKAGQIGTQKLAMNIELKKYKNELQLVEKRKHLESIKEKKSGAQNELKLLRKKSKGKTLSQKIQDNFDRINKENGHQEKKEDNNESQQQYSRNLNYDRDQKNERNFKKLQIPLVDDTENEGSHVEVQQLYIQNEDDQEEGEGEQNNSELLNERDDDNNQEYSNNEGSNNEQEDDQGYENVLENSQNNDEQYNEENNNSEDRQNIEVPVLDNSEEERSQDLSLKDGQDENRSQEWSQQENQEHSENQDSNRSEILKSSSKNSKNESLDRMSLAKNKKIKKQGSQVQNDITDESIGKGNRKFRSERDNNLVSKKQKKIESLDLDAQESVAEDQNEDNEGQNEEHNDEQDEEKEGDGDEVEDEKKGNLSKKQDDDF